MVDDLRYLFVYGTLLTGERNAGQIPDAAVQARRPARVRGTLVDLGRYPALRTRDDDGGDDGDDGDVVGELLTLTATAAPALLAALDAFEGTAYARRALPVRVDEDGATTVAWVFVEVSGGVGGPRIPDGDWRAWRRQRARGQTR